MPLKDDVLQAQLTRAKAELAVAEQQLQGGPGKKHALWRRASSRVRQIEGRMKSRTDIRSGSAEQKSGGDDEPEAAAE